MCLEEMKGRHSEDEKDAFNPITLPLTLPSNHCPYTSRFNGCGGCKPHALDVAIVKSLRANTSISG